MTTIIPKGMNLDTFFNSLWEKEKRELLDKYWNELSIETENFSLSQIWNNNFQISLKQKFWETILRTLEFQLKNEQEKLLKVIVLLLYENFYKENNND